MYDVKANKNSWTDSYSGIPNKYGDFIVVAVEIEVEDQNAIKIDDYGENIPFFLSARPAAAARQDRKAFFGDILSNDDVVKR